MAPKTALPIADCWHGDSDAYVNSLLSFTTSSQLFQNLCGGIHILDFLTRKPDLYETVLPQEWREWFCGPDIHAIMALLFKSSLQDYETLLAQIDAEDGKTWQGFQLPPRSFIEYILTVRKHCLIRDFSTNAFGGSAPARLPIRIATGMKPKKAHEVENFARYVNQLTVDVREKTGEDVSHIVDFGSGMNYLGRALASLPYEKDIIAIESKHGNVKGAQFKDVKAALAKKPKHIINKKLHKQMLAQQKLAESLPQQDGEKDVLVTSEATQNLKTPVVDSDGASPVVAEALPDPELLQALQHLDQIQLDQDVTATIMKEVQPENAAETPTENLQKTKGSLTHVECEIKDGYLEPIISHILTPSEQSTNTNSISEAPKQHANSKAMVISLHSCGNLLHHGVRSLVLNPSVSAVAMIGCCYNLMTERLGPPSYKIPVLRSLHPRLQTTSNAHDPHGFPMSKKLETFPHPSGKGVNLNITARMMAVQAPYNWGPVDSEGFFTRHFYRALFQRILLDCKIVSEPSDGESAAPLTIGSLKKNDFDSFRTYARAAIQKLLKDKTWGPLVKEQTADLTDDQIDQYEVDFAESKKNLSVIWSLMAFSAGAVESVIVVDRWQFLREHEEVAECWVEPVFEYAQSPRNLVVVGIKR